MSSKKSPSETEGDFVLTVTPSAGAAAAKGVVETVYDLIYGLAQASESTAEKVLRAAAVLVKGCVITAAGACVICNAVLKAAATAVVGETA